MRDRPAGPPGAVVYEDWRFGDRVVRGRSITALFSGSSGTGKTMAAEILAADLELDLYWIELSGVVDKYVGETGKDLRRVFEASGVECWPVGLSARNRELVAQHDALEVL